jgi:adenosylmethionine-8-amino-7-oxononanoate aminotransferase
MYSKGGNTMKKIGSTKYPLVHPRRVFSDGPDFTKMAAGNGVYLRDTENKLYIDGISGLWNVSLGYNYQEVNDAIIEQLKKLPFVNLIENNNPTTIELAEKLIELTPEYLNKVVYTCTGSESVEFAIKLCRKYQVLRGNKDKNKIVVIDISYHGTYYGSMSASGIDLDITEDYNPKVPGFVFLPAPYCKCCKNENMDDACLDKSIKALEEIFTSEGKNLAGIMLEPFIGSGGVIPIPKKYMERIKELCDIYGVLLVFDEVATGLGRTGTMFAFEHYNIVPDILCLSKGINSGYIPLGAVLFCEKITDVFLSANTNIKHISTQNGNPLACAAGIATIESIQKNGYVDNCREMGKILKTEISNVLDKHKNFVEVRGSGLMLGINLQANASHDCLSMEQICYLTAKLKQKGLIVYSFYVEGVTTGLSLFPPLIVNKNEVMKIVSIIKQVFDRTVF